MAKLLRVTGRPENDQGRLSDSQIREYLSLDNGKLRAFFPGNEPDLDGLDTLLNGKHWPTPDKIAASHHWGWLATYEDGSHLWEYHGGEPSHAFGDIALDRVVRFRLLPFYAHLKPHTLLLVPGQQELIFFRRTAMDAMEGGIQRVYTVYGWKDKTTRPAVETFIGLLPSGEVFAMADRNVLS